MRSPTNIARHEFIGLDVVVVDAQNKSLIGIKGEIVDETKQSFMVQTEKGEKRVFKKGTSFQVSVGNQVCIIKGDILVGRPEERIKK